MYDVTTYFLRPIMVMKKNGIDSYEDDYEALFHVWSVDYQEFDNGPGQYPIAIVEGKDGIVKLVHPTLIKFLPLVEDEDNAE